MNYKSNESNKSDQSLINNDYEAIILNIYFIIRKKLNEILNNSIHNKTTPLNFLVKEEIDKFEEEKLNKYEEEYSKMKSETESINNKIFSEIKNKQNINTIIIDNKNNINEEKDFKAEKNEEKGKMQIYNICEGRKTSLIKQKIKIKDNTLEQKMKSIEKIKSTKNISDNVSSLSEFYQNLKEKETKMFDIKSIINFDAAINIYFKGEKSPELIPVNNKENQSEIHNENIEYFENILQKSSLNKSVDEINEYIEKIKQIISNNLKSLKDFHLKSIYDIEEYGEYFDAMLILKEFDLSLPLDIFEVLEKVGRKSRKSNNIELLEKCFYMIKLSECLYYDEFIGFYQKIKE